MIILNNKLIYKEHKNLLNIHGYYSKKSLIIKLNVITNLSIDSFFYLLYEEYYKSFSRNILNDNNS
jgi:hypothetical protein